MQKNGANSPAWRRWYADFRINSKGLDQQIAAFPIFE
jgi:hypothetical protein